MSSYWRHSFRHHNEAKKNMNKIILGISVIRGPKKLTGSLMKINGFKIVQFSALMMSIKKSNKFARMRWFITFEKKFYNDRPVCFELFICGICQKLM